MLTQVANPADREFHPDRRSFTLFIGKKPVERFLHYVKTLPSMSLRV
jgi:hypothetical protein